MRVKVLIVFYSAALTLQPSPFAFSIVSYKTQGVLFPFYTWVNQGIKLLWFIGPISALSERIPLT